MNKRILAISALLLILGAFFSLTAAGATPSGRSGLNYWNVPVNEWNEREIEYSLLVKRNGTDVQWYRKADRYDRWIGGFIEQFLDPDEGYNQIELQTGDVVQVTIHFGGIDLFKYCNVDNGLQPYYASATLKTGTAPRQKAYGASAVTFYDNQDAVITSGGGKYMLSSFDTSKEVEYVTFVFDITESETIGSFSLQGCTLMQNNPIYTKYETQEELVADQTSSLYVPFSEVWFADIYDSDASYDEGYQDGYEQGALDAGGAPIQRWGSFLVTSVGGFLDFEIFPGFPLWGLLAMAVAVPLLITFLKMFAGG